MSAPFFYEPFNDTAEIHLSDASIHHALNVLRMKQGDELHITNGKGKKATCKISAISKKDCAIDILHTEQNTFSSPQLHIAISFTKNNARIEWFLEKATEIGIQTITPLLTKRSEKTPTKRERFEKILISAMLQSQSTFLPTLNEPTLFADILQCKEPNKLIAHCIENETRNALKNAIKHEDTLILIGPEGDFTKEEIELSLNCQFAPVSLGNNRLRTETAGIFACVVFNTEIASL